MKKISLHIEQGTFTYVRSELFSVVITYQPIEMIVLLVTVFNRNT